MDNGCLGMEPHLNGGRYRKLRVRSRGCGQVEVVWINYRGLGKVAIISVGTQVL